MKQDSSLPPILPPSTELGALLFAVLPCLQETYRPLASFAYHMTELTKIKTIPTMPPLTRLSDIDSFITDKDCLLRSLTFYGNLCHMPLLSTIATLLRGMQFYQTYKDILPGLFAGVTGSGAFDGTPSSGAPGANAFDLFSMFGRLFPDLSVSNNAPTEPTQSPKDTLDENAPASDDALYNSLYSFLTPEQQKIYEQLMHTD